MKKLKFLFAFTIFACIAASSANAQAVVIKDGLWFLSTYDYSYVSLDAHEVYTPDGAVNMVVTFQLNLDDSLVPEKGEGVNIVPIGGGFLYVNHNGKAKWYYHYEPLL